MQNVPTVDGRTAQCDYFIEGMATIQQDLHVLVLGATLDMAQQGLDELADLIVGEDVQPATDQGRKLLPDPIHGGPMGEL